MPRISQLPALTVPDAADEIAIVDASAATTKKITRTDFLKGAALPADTVTTAAIADGAVTPEKRSGGFKTINHSFTSTTGTKTITGVGFAPKAITVFSRRSHENAAVPGIGQASFDGSTITQGAQASVVAASGNRTISSTSAAFVSAQSGTDNSLYRGIVTSFDADGITVNITSDDQAAREWTINFYG